MYKFFYDKYDKEERLPVPNLSPSTCVSHSQLYQVFCRTQNDYVISNNVSESEQKFLYPIEIKGRIEDILYDKALDNISRNCIELAKNNQIRFIINYSHEPMKSYSVHVDGVEESHAYIFFNSLKKYIVDLGLHQNMFIIYPGTFNLLELEPKLKTTGFRFNYTDTLMLNTASKLKELYKKPFFALGYETTLIRGSEIDEKRNRYFICLNRNSQKRFRFTLGCYFEFKNWWDDIYCSFLLNDSPEKSNIFTTNNVDFDKNIISVRNNFVSKMPIEFDTQKIDDKGSFESGRAYKKENGWLDSYIYVCTETEFEDNNIFLSEKSFHGVITLQPFILFAPCGHLGYMKKLGFKTFDEFIDEKYDDIEDDKERFIFLCDELNRIHNLSLDTIHEWYLSIKDKLIFNRNHLLSMANRLPFTVELPEELKSW